MKLNKLNEEVVKYFVGSDLRFVDVVDNVEFKNGKPTGNVIGSKVSVVSTDNVRNVLVVKVEKVKEELNLPKPFENIEFEDLNGTFWIKVQENRPSIELSLKAKDVKIKLM